MEHRTSPKQAGKLGKFAIKQKLPCFFVKFDRGSYAKDLSNFRHNPANPFYCCHSRRFLRDLAGSNDT
jgi:hypothetical protein